MDYAAAADALTFAPVEFNEFFNQRRRWVTSTLANQLEVLNDYKNITRCNDNISFIYIIYQFIITLSTFIGPATIVLAIATAFKAVFGIKSSYAHIMSIIPVAFFIIVTFLCKSKTQLMIAALLSAFYAGVMVVVLVGIIASFVSDSLIDPSLLFIMILAVTFIMGGVLHPYEFWCLPAGILYYLCIPAGYLILMIYSFSNMNNVSWGTREIPKRQTKQELEEEVKKAKEMFEKKKNKKGFFSFLRLDVVIKEMKDMILQVFNSKDSGFAPEQVRLMEEMNKHLKGMKNIMKGKNDDEPFQTREVMPSASASKKSKSKPKTTEESKPDEERMPEVEDPDYPWWSQDLDKDDYRDVTGGAPTEFLDPDELQFWVKFIKKYERPLKPDKHKQMRLTADLLKMRNNASFAMWFINGLWILFVFMVETNEKIKPIKIHTFKLEPTGLIFLVIFVVVLSLQLIGMIMHRWGTFLQLMSITELPNPLKNSRLYEKNIEELIELTKDLGKARSEFFDPEPDYDSDNQTLSNSVPDTHYDMTKMKDTLRHQVQTRAIIPWYHSDNQYKADRVQTNGNIEMHGLTRQRSRYDAPIHHHEGVLRNVWQQISQPKHKHKQHDERRSGIHATERRTDYSQHYPEPRNNYGHSQICSTDGQPRRRHRRQHGHHHHDNDDERHHQRHHRGHDRHDKHKRAYNFDRMFDYRLDKFMAHNGGCYN